MKKITLEISADEFAFVERMAEEDGYFGPEDCLNGILNTALSLWMYPATPDNRPNDPVNKVIALQSAKIRVLKDMLFESLEENLRRDLCCLDVTANDEAGHDGPNNSTDLNDGIPF